MATNRNLNLVFWGNCVYNTYVFPRFKAITKDVMINGKGSI